MKKQLTLQWILGLLLLFSANLCVAQTNYYVNSAIGNDANSGLIGSPKATIQAAITTASTPAIINIAAGTYAENITISKNDITLRGAGAGTNGQSSPDAVNAAIHSVISKATGKGIEILGARTNIKVTDLIIQGFTAGEGIYANSAGCDGFFAERLQVLNCGGQAGIYISGDVNGVTIDDVASLNNSGRAIAVWNNFKQNVTITNCYVVLGACCGIELQDGTASGVYIANNTIIGGASGDSGLGLSGLKGGAGPNIIENNTITVAKRYGIEVKNPAGTGTETDTEDGAIIVRNNDIIRTGTLTDVRDLAGIAIFRRAFLFNNGAKYLDVPSGVVVVNNSIDGFAQPGTGDGFGVVAEGVKMTIKNNQIYNCDIGVQRQSGNSSGYVKNNQGDSNQDANDTYFNRGNSPFSSAITQSGNTFSGNTTNTRDVFAANTYFGDTQYVLNTNNLNAFATIGLAVENAVSGNSLKLSANTFDERVIIDKSLIIDGVDNTLAKVTYTGVAITGSGNGIPSVFTANAQNITIKNIGFTINLDKVHSAINSKGNVSGIVITDNLFTAANFGGGTLPSSKLGYGRRNAVAINIDPFDADYQNINTGITGVTIQRNIVDGYLGGNPSNGGFRAGFQVDRAKDVLIGGNTVADGNISQVIGHDVICRFFTDGDVMVKNNKFNGGGLEMSSTNSALGAVTIEANTFDGVISNAYTSLARFQQNTNKKAFILKNNIFKNVKWGVSLENFNTTTLDGNTFTPSVDGFRLVTLNTKSILTSTPTTENMGVLMKNNVFNGMVGSTNGTAVAFYNHNEDGSNNYVNSSSYVLGAVGQKNSFNANIKNYILLDNSNGVATNVDPIKTAYPEYFGLPVTTTGYWTPNISADQNNFFVDGQSRAPSSLTSTQQTELNGKIFDKLDNNDVGRVDLYFAVQNVTTGKNFSTIQAAIDDVTTVNGNVINVSPKTFTLTTTLNINKEITLQGNSNDLAVKPLINGIGDATNKSLINITAKNVTLQNFSLQFDENNAKSLYGITTGANGTFDNLSLLDNEIKGTGSPYKFGSIAIYLGKQSDNGNSSQITMLRNTVGHMIATNAFGRGIRSWYINGTIGGSLANSNDIKAFYASMELAVCGGINPINISYNDLFGKFKIGGLQVGNHTVSYNKITSGGAVDASSQGVGVRGVDLQPALIEIVGSKTDNANLEISNNILNDFKYAGVSVFASSNVSVINNTLNPFANETGFTHFLFDTKTSDTQAEAAKGYKNISLKGNNFNGSGVFGGTGLLFANSNGANGINPISSLTVGGATTEANTFSTNLATVVSLDNNSGLSTAIPLWTSPFYSGTPATNVFPFNNNVDVSLNKIGAATLSSFTNLAFYNLEAKVNHGLDNGTTGFVTVKANSAFTASTVQTERAMNIVPENYTIQVKAGTDLSGASLLAKRSLTLNGEDASLAVGSLEVNETGKVLTLGKPSTANLLKLTAGKIATTAINMLTVPASGLTFTSGIDNFIDGPLSLTGISGDQVIPVGKGIKAAYIAFSNVTSGPSNFTAEYFPTSYADVSNKEAALGVVSNKEYWTLNRTSGSLNGNVQLYTFDQAASGLTGLSSTDAVVAWYNGGEWKNQGNGNFSANSITADLVNSSFSPFTFAAPPAVLPVELISFNAVAKTQGALLTWSTASERDNNHFEIQKSTDGILFSQIGTLASRANSNQVQSYEFLDNDFHQSAYYQLVQVNKDGTRRIFDKNIQYVKGLGEAVTVSVYPNPTTSSLSINYNSDIAQKISGRLVDFSGKIVQSFVGNSTSTIVLNLSKIQPGVYVLQIETKQGVETRKIIKQ